MFSGYWISKCRMGRKKSSSKQVLTPNAFEWNDDALPASNFLKHYNLPHVVQLQSDVSTQFDGDVHVDVTQPFLLHTARNCTKVSGRVTKYTETFLVLF